MRKLVFLFVSGLLFASATDVFAQEGSKIIQRPNSWKFDINDPAQAKLNKDLFKGECPATDPSAGFTLKLNVDLSKFEGVQQLLAIDNVASIKLRRVGVNERARQNYPAFSIADGSVPVLEAEIILHREGSNTKGEKMEIGFPLAMLEKHYGKHEVILNFTGARWTMYVDGRLVDNDFPIGYPRCEVAQKWEINPKYIMDAEIFAPAINPNRDNSAKSEISPVQYWTPEGHNSWVGDVATLFHNGRFHVFYLYDRRHHASKLGTGGHYFEHLSTADFKIWTEHEAATPIEQQWETFGTGTPFALDGKFYISYGLHTSRIYPDEKNMTPMLKAYYENYGKTGTFTYESFPSVPSGATYSVSRDGISDFVKSEKIIHFSENPTIYVDPDGKLTMLANFRAKGTWRSETLDGGWYCVDKNFPPGGDCTFFFRWGKFDYIIGGFNTIWSKPADAPSSEYKNTVERAEDFYNGFCVPAVSEIPQGRFLMSGWMPIGGVRGETWAGPLIIHEMVQFPDGRIGTKWMEEIIPETKTAKTIANRISSVAYHYTGEKSFILSFDVSVSNIEKDKLAVSFLPDEGAEGGCEFQLRASDLTAQYSNASFRGYADPEKSLRQGGAPQAGRNYAIEKLIGIDEPFRVRIAVKQTDKFGGTLIDTEIAGKRTMVTYRPGLSVEKLMFKADGATISNVTIAPLK